MKSIYCIENMDISEIFYSIQGEGNWTGLPNIFIRSAGCNLRCSFCDTKYAYNPNQEMPISKIVKFINRYNCKYITITGGEPLIQKDIYSLIDVLLNKGYEICLETNGSIEIDNLIDKESLMISLDIKCPSSNMNEKMNFNNLKKIGFNDQLKFIICDKTDYNYAKNILKKYNIKSSIYFQPVEGFNIQKIAQWILNDCLNVKLGLQIHKIIWGNQRGI